MPRGHLNPPRPAGQSTTVTYSGHISLLVWAPGRGITGLAALGEARSPQTPLTLDVGEQRFTGVRGTVQSGAVQNLRSGRGLGGGGVVWVRRCVGTSF